MDVILDVDEQESFELDDALLGELEVRIAEADRGEIEPLDVVLERVRT